MPQAASLRVPGEGRRQRMGPATIGVMARRPYHIARQEHLGDALDDLQRRGLLRWQWDYANSRAIYRVTLPGEQLRTLDTATAEKVITPDN
jgi:hypothetical protein